MEHNIDFSKYHNSLCLTHQIVRIIWCVVWFMFARPIPRSLFSGWKRFLLRLFGAKIDSTAIVYSSARVYYPKNLVMGAYACMDEGVICYNVAMVVLEDNVTISQRTFLCTASHDITDSSHPLISEPIIIEKGAWVAAEAFIGMGVTVREGAVVGARSAVFKDVEQWTVVGGNPARFIKKRILK